MHKIDKAYAEDACIEAIELIQKRQHISPHAAAAYAVVFIGLRQDGFPCLYVDDDPVDYRFTESECCTLMHVINKACAEDACIDAIELIQKRQHISPHAAAAHAVYFIGLRQDGCPCLFVEDYDFCQPDETIRCIKAEKPKPKSTPAPVRRSARIAARRIKAEVLACAPLAAKKTAKAPLRRSARIAARIAAQKK